MRLLLTLAALLLLSAPTAAAERCTEAEFDDFVQSVRDAELCLRIAIRGRGRAECSVPAPPPCGQSALAGFSELVAGDRDWRRALDRGASFETRNALRCQLGLASGARRYLEARAAEYRDGVRSHLESQELLFAPVERSCRGPVAGDDPASALPAVGAACAHRVPAPGQAISPRLLARCLRAAIGSLIDEIAPAPMPPNFVVIMTDDQRWDTVQYMPVVSERLASESVEFRESFVTTPVCCPSRASFFTGRYAHNTGVRDNRPPLGGAPLLDESMTIAVALREVGYRTGLFGKYMNATDLLTEVPAGWDSWNAFVSDGGNYFDYDLNQHGTVVRRANEESDYSTDAMSAMALEFIDANAHEPFFVVYTPFAPHADAGFFGASPAPRHVGAFQGFAIPRRPNYLEADLSDKPAWILSPLQILRFFGLGDVADRYFELADEFAAGQLEMLLAVDDAVGALLDELAVWGLEDNTVVVFTSDNGFAWGEHQWVSKRVPYEESIRVPLLLRYPLLNQAAVVDDHLVLNIDLAPTFAALAGASLPAGVDGRSLDGLLAGTAVAWRDDFLGEQWLGNFLLPVETYAMVRSREWKYVRYESGFEELYDLVSDPFELENQAANPLLTTVLDGLRARLSELRPE